MTTVAQLQAFAAALNERQRAYLLAAYDEDQRREERYRGPGSPPASRWRWIKYGPVGARWLDSRGTGLLRSKRVHTGLGDTRNRRLIVSLMVRLAIDGRKVVRIIRGEPVTRPLGAACHLPFQPGDAEMPPLTDRQRIELAIPAYLLFALTGTPGVFVPANPDLAARAEADIAAMRADLQAACLEPLSNLVAKKHHALLRRVERIGRGVVAGWKDQSMLSAMLMLWYFVKDLTDREVLILWEGSAMERATSRLLPMFAHGFEEQKRDAAAQDEAQQLLTRLQAEGLYD